MSHGRHRGTTPVALGAFFVGALCARSAAAFLKDHPPGGRERWIRMNHAGRPVTLLEGPSYAVGALAGAMVGGAGASAAVAALGAGGFGALDDLVGDSSSKGLRGHLASARRGEVTTGVIKIAGLGLTGLLAAWIVDRPRERARPILTEPKATGPRPTERKLTGPMGTLVGGAVIAGSANVANLLDLRPGRALKAVVLLAVPIVAAGRGTQLSAATAGAAAGAAMGAIHDDLVGRSMLGDTGANSAGALLGTALVARTAMPGRLLALAVLTALTLASEKVSFTAVIESTPGLRELDALGRPSPTATRSSATQ